MSVQCVSLSLRIRRLNPSGQFLSMGLEEGSEEARGGTALLRGLQRALQLLTHPGVQTQSHPVSLLHE